MKIVVLDGYAVNPGDLSWSALESLGGSVVYARTKPEELIERAVHADALLTNKTVLSAETIEKLPNLKYIGVIATGHNVVNSEAAKAKGVAVTNVPAYGTMSVAQHAFALLLELTNSVGMHVSDVREGGWCRSPDWCYWKQPLIELEGRTMGLVGSGRIGMAFAKICEAVGMRVITVTSKDDRAKLFALLSNSDFVSLHCPLTPLTEKIIDQETLSHFKPNSFLINTARGQLINEADLATALNDGRLAGAVLDVLSTEPPLEGNPLLNAKNCLITPHVAWASAAARQRLLGVAIDNLRAFLAGQQQNLV